MSSVPSSKISTTDDRPSTDFERIVLSHEDAVQRVLERHGDQALDLLVDSPGASVWISTSGGANSGKTSSGASRAAQTPDHEQHGDAATTTRRRESECR